MYLPMKDVPHEPRSVTILRHVAAYLLPTSESAYADDVRRRYHERTPDPKARCIQFYDSGDPLVYMPKNEQLVSRILGRKVRMPVDLEEALILALPAEAQRACWVDLAARVGRMSIAHPEDGVRGVAEDLGRLARDVGELLTSLAPLLDDLRIDEHDELVDLVTARERARQLSSQVHTVIEQLSRSIAKKQGTPACVRAVSRETGRARP